jgi:hypothetical protein
VESVYFGVTVIRQAFQCYHFMVTIKFEKNINCNAFTIIFNKLIERCFVVYIKKIHDR